MVLTDLLTGARALRRFARNSAWRLRGLVPAVREQRKADADSLRKFILQLYHGENLTPAQSRQSLEESVVELTDPWGGHSSNGILITNSGYFLTALHCITGLPLDSYVRIANVLYRVEKLCAYRKSEDLALGKIAMGGSGARSYRLHQENFLPHMSVRLLTRRSGEIVRKHGFAQRHQRGAQVVLPNGGYTKPQYPYFTFDVPTQLGDSGGVYVCPEGRLIGIHVGAYGTPDRSYLSHSDGIRLFSALELIERYAQQLSPR